VLATTTTIRGFASTDQQQDDDVSQAGVDTEEGSFDRSLLFSSLGENDKRSASIDQKGGERAMDDLSPDEDLKPHELLFSSLGDHRANLISDDDDDVDEEEEEEGDGRSESAALSAEPMFAGINTSCLGILKSHYYSEHGVKISDDAFESICVNTDDKDLPAVIWTSVFTCPLNGKKYPSGRLRQNYRPVEDSGRNNAVCYQRKLHSTHAAAARALDAIQYQQRGIVEPRFCEEDPSTSIESLTPTLDPVVSIPSNSEPEGIATIERCYTMQIRAKLIEDCFESEQIQHNGLSTWTTAFTCPVSKITFLSGRLRKEYVPVRDVEKESGRNFYRKKAEARRAAVARAYDALQFQRRGVAEPRFCEEEPSAEAVASFEFLSAAATRAGTAVGSLGVVGSATNVPSTIAAPDKASRLDMRGDLPSAGKEDYKSILSGESSDKSSDLPDEEEYQVVQLGKHDKRSPLHRLLEVASSTIVSSRSTLANDSVSPASVPGLQRKSYATGIEKAKAAIGAADTWVTSALQSMAPEKNKSLHRLNLPKQESPASLLVGKAILARLAEANQAWSVGSVSGVEPWAKKIIEVLWKMENFQPDADAYNLYLKCLSRKDPKVSLEEAEDIVASMKSGECYKNTKRVLPKPNQGTINALIQLTAQVGGTSGRYAKHTDDDFVPDRESFLSVLSSCNYRPMVDFEAWRFDPDFASECIHRMSELATATGDALLQPDTQVYNAPLRWSGGPVLWAKSRPYARYVPWPKYETIYARGLRESLDDDAICVQEAKDVEGWLESMLQMNATNKKIAPDIETYEAAIQGWLRTATRDGLERAESILERLMSPSSTVKPRLQTFHPLIAAWHHSQEPNALSKTLDWAKRMEEVVGEVAEEMISDPRIVEIQLVSYLTEQRRLMDEMTAPKQGEDLITGVFDAARKCSSVFETAFTRLEQQSLGGGSSGSSFLDMRFFAHTGQAWSNVSAACAKCGEKNQLDKVFAEIDDLFAIFESMVELLIEAETSDGFVFGSQSFSTQLAHIVVNAHQFFYVLLETLISMEVESMPESQADDVVFRTLLMLEKMTRMIGEFQQIESHFAAFDSESTAGKDHQWGATSSIEGSWASEDQFSYGLKDDNQFSPSRYSCLWQLVKNLEQSSLQRANKGDVARLCHLIKDVGKTIRSSPKMEEAIDKILDRVLPGAPHRALSSDEIAQKDFSAKKRRSSVGTRRSSPMTPRKRRPAPNTAKAKQMSGSI